MAVPWRPLAWKALLCGAAALLLWTAGRTAWRLQVGADLVRRSAPWQRSLAQPALRLLIVGDSTAVGTGASGSASGLAGLLGQAFPRLLIENRARDGATFADLPAQLRGPARFDLVLVMAGGNDVVRLRALPALRDDIDRVLALAHARAGQVVLMPAGNVGNAPFFLPPLSWWMTWRARRLHPAVQAAARRHGTVVVNLFRERAADPFVQQPALQADDGLHPADAGYRLWFAELMTQAQLPRRLAAATVAAPAPVDPPDPP